MTEFASSWDAEVAAEVMPTWISREYMAGALLDVADLVRAVELVVQAGASACIPSIAVVPRPKPGGGGFIPEPAAEAQ
jgi:hypothetical protein